MVYIVLLAMVIHWLIMRVAFFWLVKHVAPKKASSVEDEATGCRGQDEEHQEDP